MLRRRTVTGAGAAFALLLAWASGATWYMVFRDDVAAHFLARQAELRFDYEERVNALRTRLDRVTAQKLVEQDGFESRVADLASRHAQIEMRLAALSSLAEQAVGPVAKAAASRNLLAAEPAPNPWPEEALGYAPAPKPAPAPEPLGLRPTGPATAPADLAKGSRPKSSASALDRLRELDRAAMRLGAAQAQALEGLTRRAEGQLGKLRSAVAATGLDPDALAAAERPGTGGPLVPVPADGPDGFEAGVVRLEKSVLQLANLRRTATALPFGRPVAGEPDLTSTFGVRLDPFTRAPALHTGLDFRAEHGAAARAAGSGRVIAAEYAGGYGNMVEIDHGHGVTTRYAHLSAIAVAPGQRVAAGAVVGRVGSTGRSTGAHLHYETRLDGEPVDPQRFLRAGRQLATLNADGGAVAP